MVAKFFGLCSSVAKKNTRLVYKEQHRRGRQWWWEEEKNKMRRKNYKNDCECVEFARPKSRYRLGSLPF